MSAALRIRTVGVEVGVPAKPLPANTKIELQRELDRIRSAVALIEQTLSELGETEATSLSEDAVVDQRTVPAPPDLYLRLARQGAFPSNRLGKRILARWGDVRRALLGSNPGLRKTSGRSEALSSEGDPLDGLRQHLGLVTKRK